MEVPLGSHDFRTFRTTPEAVSAVDLVELRREARVKVHRFSFAVGSPVLRGTKY